MYFFAALRRSDAHLRNHSAFVITQSF